MLSDWQTLGAPTYLLHPLLLLLRHRDKNLAEQFDLLADCGTLLIFDTNTTHRKLFQLLHKGKTSRCPISDTDTFFLQIFSIYASI